MHQMKKNIFLLVLILFSLNSFSQEVKGTIKDLNGNPLAGVAISTSTSNFSSISDLEGNFSISYNSNDKIIFTYLGFQTLQLNPSTSTMEVVMSEETTILSNVVVVGYGTKKVGAITGSVSQIKATDIIKTPSQSAIQAIQGKAAGINIVTNDEPGANPSIRIRGLGTLLGGRDPLYIIDGIEASSLNGLSPNEISTLDILKDASSLAIYGQKGANGVVVVTTKKGKGALKVSYDAYYGQKFIQRKVEMADSYRFAYYSNSALGSTNYFNFDQPYNTDWLDEITETGEVTSNHVSLAGGSDNANYYFGVTHYTEKGILIGTNFERTNLNSRNDFKLFDNKLKISPSINITLSKNTPKPLSAFTNAYKQSPIVPVKFDNGRWGVPLRNETTGLIDINGSDRFNNVANPAAQLYYFNEQNKNFTLFGSIATELSLYKNIKFNSNFGAEYNVSRGFTYTPSREIFLSQNPTKEIVDYPNQDPLNILNQRRGSSYRWNWDNFVTFTKEFDNSNLTVVAGMSRTTDNGYESISGTRWNVPEQSNYWTLDFSTYNNEIAPGAVVRNSNATPLVSIAYFARASYSLNDKYLFDATIRREGISSFLEDKRWGVFPSFSAGWILTKEDFMQNLKFINFLKIRAGYGEVGNANALGTNRIVFSSGTNYAFGSDETILPGTTIPFQVDPNLTWETMKEVDFGLDFTLLNNKLSGTIDYYNRKSENVILPVILPSVLSPGAVNVNTGAVSNKGVEVSFKWEDKINDKLSYWVGGNFSHNKNELTEAKSDYFANYIGGSLNNGQFTKQVIVGEPLGSFYVYEVTGFNSSGEFTYSSERKVAGSYIPTETFGISFGGKYKNFDFSVDTYGVTGNKIYNGKKAQRFGGENVESAVLENFWIPSNTNAANPYPFYNVPLPSSYYVEDGSFLRINNITVGYTLPKFWNKISKFRVYATAINPFIFTKYTGFSPEVSGNNNANPLGTAGIELDAYPTNKTFLIGLNVSL